MKRRTTGEAKASMHAWATFIAGFCMLLLASQSHGQQSLDLRAILQETQKMSQVPPEMILVWWLPEQFWQASQGQNPTVTEAQVNRFLDVTRRYTLIAVAAGQMGAFGGVTYKSGDAVRTGVTIRDARGSTYAPLSGPSVDPDMKNLLEMMKPVVANMIGPLGQNTHFLLFPAKSEDGRPVADPTSEGALYVVVGGKEFKYRLPLGSVLPPKYDPDTGERFPGNYSYNPFTGRELHTGSSNKALQPPR